MHRSFEAGAGRTGRRTHRTDRRRRGDDPTLSRRPLPSLLGLLLLLLLLLLFGAAPLLGPTLFLGPAAGGAAGGHGRCGLVDQAVPDEELVRRGRRGF